MIFFFLCAGAFAQNVASINGQPVGSKEFMWFYLKHHPENQKPTTHELEEFLTLYLNFRLKVMDAKQLGFDRDTAYLNEIKNYERVLRTKKDDSKVNLDYIINEYKNAVLMFNVSELKVWNKGQNDEAQLREYYNTHQSLYQNTSFDEAKEKVIADYQLELEKEWITALRKQYTVKVNPSELKRLSKP